MAGHASSTKSSPDGFPSETGQTPSISNALQIFLQALDGISEASILDTGPVCGENINFFGRRVKKLYVCDMFLRLDLDHRKGVSPELLWRDLDYEPETFDGILLWDLLNHLEEEHVGPLMEFCRHALKPGGMLMVFLLGQKTALPGIDTFVIDEGFRLYRRPQPHLDLRLFRHKERDLLAELSRFKLLKSFITHEGLKELLFQKP